MDKTFAIGGGTALLVFCTIGAWNFIRDTKLAIQAATNVKRKPWDL